MIEEFFVFEVLVNIGVVGFVVMGLNFVCNFVSCEGNMVVIFNCSYEKIQRFFDEYFEVGFVLVYMYQDFVDLLQKLCIVIIMVKVGGLIDVVIDVFVDVFELGDIIVDGGNVYFFDMICCEKVVCEIGINFVGVGIFGGEEGVFIGFFIMFGGLDELWVMFGLILKFIVVIVEGEFCVMYVGYDGVGYFVKMVYNGIEYVDMQFIVEVYDFIWCGMGKVFVEIVDIFVEWNKGEFELYLIEIIVEVLCQVDVEIGKLLVDVIFDQVGVKGIGVWIVQIVFLLGVLVFGIVEVIFVCLFLFYFEQCVVVVLFFGLDEEFMVFVDEVDVFIEDVCFVLYVLKIVVYLQGFDEICVGVVEYGWNIDFGVISKIWCGGCIICVQFFNCIVDVYVEIFDLLVLMMVLYFVEVFICGQFVWCCVVVIVVQVGILVLVFFLLLLYYDGICVDWFFVVFVQGQCDFFGVYIYKCIDKEGIFYMLWLGDCIEIEVEDMY